MKIVNKESFETRTRKGIQVDMGWISIQRNQFASEDVIATLDGKPVMMGGDPAMYDRLSETANRYIDALKFKTMHGQRLLTATNETLEALENGFAALYPEEYNALKEALCAF